MTKYTGRGPESFDHASAVEAAPITRTRGLLIRPDGVIAAQFTTASVNPPHAVQLARTQTLHPDL